MVVLLTHYTVISLLHIQFLCHFDIKKILYTMLLLRYKKKYTSNMIPVPALSFLILFMITTLANHCLFRRCTRTLATETNIFQKMLRCPIRLSATAKVIRISFLRTAYLKYLLQVHVYTFVIHTSHPILQVMPRSKYRNDYIIKNTRI